jgi:SOS response regulatory protein OraA/RecX
MTISVEDQKTLVDMAHKYGSKILRESVEIAIAVMRSDRKQRLFDLLVSKGFDADIVQEVLDERL